MKERILTPGARAEYEDFKASSSGCCCHLGGAPCGHCTHPGNPFNQVEDPSCWQEVGPELVEVMTSHLIGLALDWATGVAEGLELELPSAVRGRTHVVWCEPFAIKREGKPDFIDKTRHFWRPSTDWSQSGPLIDKYTVMVRNYPNSEVGEKASARWAHEGVAHWQSGAIPQIALCRAIVAAKLGEVVSVPAELVAR